MEQHEIPMALATTLLAAQTVDRAMRRRARATLMRWRSGYLQSLLKLETTRKNKLQ
jgi:hypothetical protein